MSVVDGDSAAAAALVRADVLVDAPVAAPSAADASVTSSRGKAENDSSFQNKSAKVTLMVGNVLV